MTASGYFFRAEDFGNMFLGVAPSNRDDSTLLLLATASRENARAFAHAYPYVTKALAPASFTKEQISAATGRVTPNAQKACDDLDLIETNTVPSSGTRFLSHEQSCHLRFVRVQIAVCAKIPLLLRLRDLAGIAASIPENLRSGACDVLEELSEANVRAAVFRKGKASSVDVVRGKPMVQAANDLPPDPAFALCMLAAVDVALIGRDGIPIGFPDTLEATRWLRTLLAKR